MSRILESRIQRVQAHPLSFIYLHKFVRQVTRHCNVLDRILSDVQSLRVIILVVVNSYMSTTNFAGSSGIVVANFKIVLNVCLEYWWRSISAVDGSLYKGYSLVHSQNATGLMQVVDFTGLMQVANKLYQAC